MYIALPSLPQWQLQKFAEPWLHDKCIAIDYKVTIESGSRMYIYIHMYTFIFWRYSVLEFHCIVVTSIMVDQTCLWCLSAESCLQHGTELCIAHRKSLLSTLICWTAGAIGRSIGIHQQDSNKHGTKQRTFWSETVYSQERRMRWIELCSEHFTLVKGGLSKLALHRRDNLSFQLHLEFKGGCLLHDHLI